jgi:hypothetical protein
MSASIAIASHNRSGSNAHRQDGIYHGIYTEHTDGGENGWYFHAWTEHGHGNNKAMSLFHGGATHYHCSKVADADHVHCSRSELRTNHASAHEAPFQAPDYNDGHGINLHQHNGPFQ